ncbi:hypothetical protein PVAG01_01679 [Phlyctema vagabunda]|uniref:Uncharacterized protein n=1 Tax=Phlyctema vagabunda TaxID=108571 RepID=A0ABR4PXS3_9HELO
MSEDYYVADIGEPEPETDPLTHIPQKKFEELNPPVNETVALISRGVWHIGSLIICEILTDENKTFPDAVSRWDDNGITFCLRRRSAHKAIKDHKGDALVSRLMNDKDGTQALWNISPNASCRVRSWAEGHTKDATTIK